MADAVSPKRARWRNPIHGVLAAIKSRRNQTRSLAKRIALEPRRRHGSFAKMRLDDKLFLQIIDATPLVSIDLIIYNQSGHILLGRRLNRPAQGFWFVPGGRIFKNETVTAAFNRISRAETGVVFQQPVLLGVYDHIYDDNFAGAERINTHYVVIAYRCAWPEGAVATPDPQHSDLRWWEPPRILQDPEVHQNTKAYFR